MKKQIIILMGLFIVIVAQAQQDSILSLKDLAIPNAPAFILLDEAPTSIERPTTTKAFTLSLLNSTKNGTELPKNYAVEFTPFWFFKHDSMTALDYIGLGSRDLGKNIFTNIKKSSVSIAFINNNDTTPQVSNLSVGIRCNLISIWSKKDELDIRGRYAAAVHNLRNRAVQLRPPTPTGDKKYDSEATAVYLKATELLLNELEEQPSALTKELIKRPVFAIDIAAGYHEFFLDKSFSNNHFGRFGVWLTCNYAYNFKNHPNCYLNFYAVGRYLKDGTQLESNQFVKKEYTDAGLKVEFECKKISLAYEWVQRVNKNENTTRSNGTLKYRISEQLCLVGAFGKNFGMNDNLISLLGINWGFSTGEEKTHLRN
jgi:hypothetical protein